MADCFISYARHDGKDLASQLHGALEDRRKDAWVDLHDIPPASRWEEDLKEGVAKSDAFVFVMTPASVEA